MVLRRRQLVVARLVRHPGHGKAAGVADGRAQVDRVGGVGQVLALHDEGPHALAQVRLAHGLGVVAAPGRVARLHDRQASPAVLDQAAAEPREAGSGRGLPRAVVLDHGVVVHVGDGAALVRVQPHGREVPDDDGLEVHHQVLAERRVVQPREEEEARRLDGAARHDDQLGLPGVRVARPGR